jgi:hypothetical protein
MREICPKEAFRREFLRPYEELVKILMIKKDKELKVQRALRR